MTQEEYEKIEDRIIERDRRIHGSLNLMAWITGFFMGIVITLIIT